MHRFLLVMANPQSAILHTFPLESATKKTNLIPTTTLSIAGFIADEPACGEITVSKNIKQHPTAKVMLYLRPTATETVDDILEAKLTQYCMGTEIELFGTTYIVNKQITTEKSIKQNLTDQKMLELELVGKWAPQGANRRSPLDEPYKVTNTNNQTIEDVIALSGETYVGPTLDIYYQGNSLTNVVVPRQVLESNAISMKGFVYYSNADALEVREWGKTTLRQLPLSIVATPDLKQVYSGFGATVDGVKLVAEYRNARFVPKKVIGNTGVQILVEYENATNEDEFNAPLYESDTWFLFGPAVIEPFRNGNNNFDNSSQVRKKRLLEVKNGETISQSEFIKGWEYNSADFYTITTTEITWDPPSILVVNGFWKTVETSNTTKYYDGDGYWIGDSTTGQRRVRYKQETGIEYAEAQREVLNDPGNTTLENIRDTYLFFDFAIDGNVFVNLENKGDFYADMRPGDDGVNPKFARRIRKVELNLVTAPDPGSTEEDPLPDMVTGRDFFQETIQNIMTPESSTSPQEPERYRQINYTRNAQGEALSRYAKAGSSTENAGRPGNAKRLIDLTGDYVSPPSDLVAGGSYLLVSQGAEINVSADLERQTVSFDNVFDLTTLLEVAQVDLSQKNTGALTTSVMINEFILWDEGDLVNYRNRTWVLNGYSFTIKPERIEGVTRLLNQSYTLNLGSYLLPSIDAYVVNEDDELELLGSI